MHKVNSLVFALTAAFAFYGCGDDKGNGTGPDNPDFPSLPASFVAEFCVRSDASPGVTRNGTINNDDCGDAQNGWFESYRVRVSSTRNVTFDANSSFDNVLALVSLTFNADRTQLEDFLLVAENDDRSQTNLNALISNVQLQQGRDYLVAIGGFDAQETGNYTLQIQ